MGNIEPMHIPRGTIQDALILEKQNEVITALNALTERVEKLEADEKYWESADRVKTAAETISSHIKDEKREKIALKIGEYYYKTGRMFNCYHLADKILEIVYGN